jgi:probable rRNA maturation factor
MTVEVRNRQRLLRVDTRLLKELAVRALKLAGAADYHLSLVLVTDETMAALNRQYHHTTGTTDVLSFPYSDAEGEVIISVERALSQAERFKSTPGHEMVLYLVHGILHLRGYDDATPRERASMRAAEARLLRQLALRGPLRRLVRRTGKEMA